MTTQPDMAMSKATKQDIEQLVKRGNALVKALEELTADNMQKAGPNLLGLQWWSSAKIRIEAWRVYMRALERDGIL